MEKEQVFHWSELNYVCLLLRLGRNILLILMAGLIAVMLSLAAVQVLHEDAYSASATLAVNVKSSGYSAVLSDLSATSEIATTFTQLFESNMFGEVAASQLGVSSLPGTLSASVIPETNLLTLCVTASSPEDAFRTLQLMLDNYDALSEHAFQNIILKELNSPSVPTAPSNPVDFGSVCKKAFVVGVGIMVLFLLAAALQADTIQSTAAFRRKLDARLFATIHHEQKNKTLKAKLKQANKGLLITMPAAGFHFTEEIGKLALKVEYAAKKAERKVILVTSVAENEGKSTVAANLALSLAQSDHKVLLVDGDLHKAAQFKLLGHKPKQELAAILKGKAPCTPDYLEEYDLYTLFSTTASEKAAELLASEGITRLLETCRKDMDYIIIDTPPMAMFSDVEVLADQADLSILVVRQDCVPARVINDTVDVLEQCKADFLGCVFNDVRSAPFTSDHHGYGYYGYGYGYGYQYGYGGYDKGHRSRWKEKTSGQGGDHGRA